jgi:chemotaxis protein methyltransferase CheR
MRISDFDLYKDLLKKESGLQITPDKSYLLDSRLTPIAKKWNYPTLDSMTIAIRGVPEPELVKDIVEAMTDLETSFFRNIESFNFFSDIVLPFLLKRRKKREPIRIWSCGCSSGQEAYSLSILLNEHKSLTQGYKFEIVASDINSTAIENAEKGLFSQFDVQRGLPVNHLIKYFDPEDDQWKIKPQIKEIIEFEQINLLQDFSKIEPFDIVFCRNVLKSFDRDTKIDCLQRLAEIIYDDGFLFLGQQETVVGISDDFRPLAGVDNVFILNESDFDEKKHINSDKAVAS